MIIIILYLLNAIEQPDINNPAKKFQVPFPQNEAGETHHKYSM